MALAATACSVTPAQASSLVSSAPREVARGDRFVVLVDGADLRTPAAYQGAVAFDHHRATLLGVTQPADRIASRGRAVQTLGPVRRGRVETFGFYSCAAIRCGMRRLPQGAGRRLTSIELQAERPGLLRLRLAGIRTSDAAGSRVASSRGVRTLTVRVLPGSARPRRGRATARLPLRVVRSPGPRGPVDRNGDGIVDAADAAELALDWTLLKGAGSECRRRRGADVNGDGCVDVTDVQLAAARAARRTRARASANQVFTVDATSDAPDAVADGVCQATDGTCSLRAAITEANNLSGPNTVAFKIPGAGVQTIQLASRLPSVSDTTGPTTIDGYSQPGSAVNTDPLASNAKLMVQVRGTGSDGIDGLVVTSARNVVKGVAFYDLRRSIWLYGSGSQSNALLGDYIGTDAAGIASAPAYNVYGSGVTLEQGAASNRIGGTSLAARNVISGNARHGVATYTANTNRNVIANNIIGLSPGGDRSLLNYKHGIDINSGSSYNRIGGTAALQRNVISGNGDGNLNDFTAGVEVSHSVLTVGNLIVGNYIGTDLTGQAGPAYTANSMYGIRIEDAVNDTTISDNVIGNNLKGGIKIDAPFTTNNRMSNNRIGVSVTGAPIPNGVFGVLIAWRATHTMIGPNNVIANNPVGVEIGHVDSDWNTITRNSFYANSGLGIDLEPWTYPNPNDPGDADTGTNEQLNYPVITSASSSTVSGTACAGCVVELFAADSPAGAYGEGQTYLASATADSVGQFSASIAVPAGTVITSTATDPAGNTSEFSLDVTAP